MCPLCVTNAALVAAGATSGVGVLGFVIVKMRALRQRRREPSQPKSINRNQSNK